MFIRLQASWEGVTRLQASWEGPNPNRLVLVAQCCLAPSSADGITLPDCLSCGPQPFSP